MTRYYLAHPSDSRVEMRQWQLHMQVSFDTTEIINPFYDITRADITEIDAGNVGRYEKLNAEELVSRDLHAIEDSDGVIAYVNGDFSIGTIMEIAYASLYGLPVYIICTNGHEEHPWLKTHSEMIFTTIEECEQYLLDAE